MKSLTLTLICSFLSLTLSVGPVAAQEFLTNPELAAPAINLETAGNTPDPTAPSAPLTSTEFLSASPLSQTPPQSLASEYFSGVTDDGTVSGVVNIAPNLTLHPDIRKVAYYLDGTKSGRVYQSPFLWGGLTGDGSQGFDTRTLPNGTYTLGMGYTDSTGDHSTAVTFTVDNTSSDTTAPVIGAVTSLNMTSSGATISWTTNEASDSQVEYRIQGTTVWSATNINTSLVTNHSVALSGLSASSLYEYRVKSKDPAGNLATQATISNFTTLTPTAPIDPVAGDFAGVTNGVTISGTVYISPNFTLHPGIRKVSYYLNGTKSGKVYQSPFLWGGLSGDGSQGFDTRILSDGAYTLGMGYTDATGDHSASVTFMVDNTSPDVIAPAISMIGSASITTSRATISWATNEASDSQVEYRVLGTTGWSTTVLNTSLVANHSVILTGLSAGTVYEYRVKSKDQLGNLATQAAISPLTTATPILSEDGYFVGVRSGATLDDVIDIHINPDSGLVVQKVSYYLFGIKFGTEYAPPFAFGLPHLSNGTYTLAGVMSVSGQGERSFSYTFTVNNPASPLTANVLMLGDSITAWNNWETNLGRSDVVNGGIPGEVTANFLTRLPQIYDAAPKIVFVLGGINDFFDGYSVNQVYSNYVQILQGLVAHGIRPVIQSTVYVSEDRPGMNQKVTELNTLLLSYAQANSLDYMDLNVLLSENGHIKPEYTPDGVHLNRAADQIWQDEVLAMLVRYGI